MPDAAPQRASDAHLHRDARGAPGGAADPIRGGAGRRRGARPPPAAAGPGRLGDRRRRPCARRRSGSGSLAAASARRSRSSPGLPTASLRCSATRRCRRCRSPGRRDRWSRASPRSNRRSARARWSALIHAAEAGADGVAKLEAAARRRLGAAAVDLPVIRIFEGRELDLAIGRANVIHAALLAGPAGDNALNRVRALADFLGGDMGVGGARSFDRAAGSVSAEMQGNT